MLQPDRRWGRTGAVLLQLVMEGYPWTGRLRVAQGLLLLWLGGNFVVCHAALAGDRATGCGCVGWLDPTRESRPKTEERMAVGMATGMLVLQIVTLVAARGTSEAEAESGPDSGWCYSLYCGNDECATAAAVYKRHRGRLFRQWLPPAPESENSGAPTERDSKGFPSPNVRWRPLESAHLPAVSCRRAHGSSLVPAGPSSQTPRPRLCWQDGRIGGAAVDRTEGLASARTDGWIE